MAVAPNGRIIVANHLVVDWLGYNAGELIGRRFQDLLHIAGKIYYETHFVPLLRMQGFFFEVALDLICAAGPSIPVLINAVESRTQDGGLEQIRMAVFKASDRRRYESELLEARRQADRAAEEIRKLNLTLENRVYEAVEQRMRAEEELRQVQKMEAIGQLTGGVAHDFNNLLTVVLGGLETIGRQLPELPPGPAVSRIDRAMTMATQGAQRAATLTARLLAFSRRQALDPKPIDANKLVTGLSELLERTLGETITLQTVSGAGLWKTHADPAQLENAIINLAVNARDAMSGAGHLTIETTNAFLDEEYVSSLAETVAPGQYVLIAVTDTGTGMDSETLRRVFEPFFTTKPSGQGTGLGLSQVYGFVRQSGGHVRIYSELGEGTTVKMYLPRLDSSTASGADPRPPSPAPLRRGTETILVVEDHEQLLEYSSSVLMELGYRVIAAASGPSALLLLEENDPIDLLFTDVVLPGGMDGRQLANEAQRKRPGLKVLFTTGYTRNAIVHNGRLDPDVKLIGKPFTASELAAKVRSVIDR